MPHVYSELSCYSPEFDSMCLRISVSDGHGGEFFCILPIPALGRSLRDARARALSTIEAAMESGMYPGEVEIDQTSEAPVV